MGIISLQSVSKSYRSAASRLLVLREVDLEIEAGEFVVAAGPSGSGKSTLLNLIGGLDRPDSGTVRIEGVDLGRHDDRSLARIRNEKLGFVFQSFHLIPVLTATENVAWPLFLRGMERRRRVERSKELLARVGLAEHMHRTPGRLSGGQRQRVAIARALACGPRIVLADEPTGNLDRRTALEIMELFASLNRDGGVTFVLSTHDPKVLSYAGRRLVLLEGDVRDTSAEPGLDEDTHHA
ncbi:MAG: ABC transporter ATP-binding protein [Thiotrichales bacterium]|nr:ABC transporter ATP-binding protein [Thiotrichales bacterium]